MRRCAVHKYRHSKLAGKVLNPDEIGRIIQTINQELSPETRSQFEQRLQVIAQNASWPRPEDRPAVDAKRLKRLEDTAAKLVKQLRLSENRRDLFAAKLNNPDRSVLIAAQLIGREQEYSEWLDRLVADVSCLHDHAATAADAARTSRGTRGPAEGEFTDLLANLMHARCLTTGEEPPREKSGAKQQFGKYFEIGGKIFNIPPEKRSLLKLIDRYWGNPRRQHIEAKIKARQELTQSIEVFETVAVAPTKDRTE
jgi:hypothetical protein